MKIYITCPISHTQNRLNLKPKLANIVKENGFDVFVTIVGGTSTEIFDRDYKELKSSDILLAEVSEPSHGVGMEIGLSYEMGLARILLLEKGKHITKFAQGMPDTSIIEYENEDELKTKLVNELASLVDKDR